MDPARIRAYLQVACAGLGFDIGEVWWTSSEEGSSTVAAIEPTLGNGNEGDSLTLSSYNSVSGREKKKRLRFMQLYTSKSFDDRRGELVNPPSEKTHEDDGTGRGLPEDDNSSDHNKHVLSPRLVDAISNTAQVIWANCQKTEGFLGRSDMRLLTAVGMPVASDADGNMLVVVMFSPLNLQSSDDAMDYLQSISRCAASSSIPCLLPVMEGQPLVTNGKTPTSIVKAHSEPQYFGAGVTARFVSFREDKDKEQNSVLSTQLATSGPKKTRELSAAPTDTFGVPMLPQVAEIEGIQTYIRPSQGSESPLSFGSADAFDEASYGVWSTIMNSESKSDDNNAPNGHCPSSVLSSRNSAFKLDSGNALVHSNSEPSLSRNSSSSTVSLLTKPILPPQQRERLEEFAAAFLDVSKFDAADVWIPSGEDGFDSLSQVTSVVATDRSDGLNFFKRVSSKSTVKAWSGALGRAYGSGNPVWSSNKDAIIDNERTVGFETAGIRSVLAIPIFSPGIVTPSCVFCCYALLKVDSVPFVLRFVQQALRLLWEGLDHVEPHKSVGKELWKDVAPADLGEMAGDTEMQKAFIAKKRPFVSISSMENSSGSGLEVVTPQIQTSNLESQFRSMPVVEEASRPANGPKPPFVGLAPAPTFPSHNVTSPHEIPDLPLPKVLESSSPEPPKTFASIQNHLHSAVRSVGEAVPWTTDNSEGIIESRAKRQQIMPTNVPLGSSSPIQILHQTTSQTQQGLFPSGTVLQVQDVPTGMQQPQYQTAGQVAQLIIPSSGHSNVAHNVGSTIQIAHVNHSQVPVMVTSASQGHIQQSQQPEKQDRAVILANIEAFNALARNHNAPIVTQASQEPHQAQFAQNVQIVGTTNQITLMHQQQPTSSILVSEADLLNGAARFAQKNLGSTNATVIGSEVSNGGATVVLPDAVNSGAAQFCLPAGTIVGVLPNQLQLSSGKRCRIQGCSDLAVARRPYCTRHSGNRICEHPGCSKCAQGSTRFCIAHGGGRRCTKPGCDKGARDKYFCAAHGGGKRCNFEGCTKSAVGGSNLCTSHGGGRRCAIEGCDKSAQSSTKYCVKHGGGKKCAYGGCEKVARGRTMYCAAHGGGVRCKLEGCNRVAIGKMQLCRAHGGGSMVRKSQNNRVLSQADPASPQGSAVIQLQPGQTFSLTSVPS